MSATAPTTMPTPTAFSLVEDAALVSTPRDSSAVTTRSTRAVTSRGRPGVRRPRLMSSDTGSTALLPRSESIAGSSQTADSMTSTTVPVAAKARPVKKPMPMNSRPSSPMITVDAANTTARPEVLTASRAAFFGACPARIAWR